MSQRWIAVPSFGLCALIAVASGACGGSGPAAPTATPMPNPAPTPAPDPKPSPAPFASPSPCTQGLCEEPTTNTNPPVRATLRMYFVEDGQGNKLSLHQGDAIPAGSLVHIDLTAKDAANDDTLGNGQVEFFFNDLTLVNVQGNHTYQRKLQVLSRGTLDCWAKIDGVDSNVLRLRFK